MNTAGILGGIVSTSLTPIIVKYFGWLPALGSGAAVAVACAGLWLVIGRRPPMQPLFADSHSENRS
jgi:Mg/Co/Ni transporter MgtE